MARDAAVGHATRSACNRWRGCPSARASSRRCSSPRPATRGSLSHAGAAWLARARVVCAVCGVWSKAPALFGAARVRRMGFHRAAACSQPVARDRAVRRRRARGVDPGGRDRVADARDRRERGRGARRARARRRSVRSGTTCRASRSASAVALVSDAERRSGCARPRARCGRDPRLDRGPLLRRRCDGYKLRLAALAWAWVWFLPISHLIAPVHIMVADRYAFLWALRPASGSRSRSNRHEARCGSRSPEPRLPARRAHVAGGAGLDELDRAVLARIRDEPARSADVREPGDPLRRRGRPRTALRILDAGLAARPREPHAADAEVADPVADGRHDEAVVAAAHRGRIRPVEHGVALRGAARARRTIPSEAVWWARRAATRIPSSRLPAHARHGARADRPPRRGRVGAAHRDRVARAPADRRSTARARCCCACIATPRCHSRSRGRKRDPVLADQVRKIEAQLPSGAGRIATRNPPTSRAPGRSASRCSAQRTAAPTSGTRSTFGDRRDHADAARRDPLELGRQVARGSRAASS